MCGAISKGHLGSQTLLQQINPPVLNWGCQLTQAVLYAGCKMVTLTATQYSVVISNQYLPIVGGVAQW